MASAFPSCFALVWWEAPGVGPTTSPLSSFARLSSFTTSLTLKIGKCCSPCTLAAIVPNGLDDPVRTDALTPSAHRRRNLIRQAAIRTRPASIPALLLVLGAISRGAFDRPSHRLVLPYRRELRA